MVARSSRPAASYWLTESRRCLTIFSSTASTWASSSSMRSSTSFCLIAALASRITPRLCLSPLFIAAFMSSVSRCLRLMAESLGWREAGPTAMERKKPAAHLGAAGLLRSEPGPGQTAGRGERDQYRRWRLVTSREARRDWRFTAAAALRLRSWVGFS